MGQFNAVNGSGIIPFAGTVDWPVRKGRIVSFSDLSPLNLLDYIQTALLTRMGDVELMLSTRKAFLAAWELGFLPVGYPIPFEHSSDFTHDGARTMLTNLYQIVNEAVIRGTHPNKLPTIRYHGACSYSREEGVPVIVPHEQDLLLRTFLRERIALDTVGLENAGVNNPSRTVKAIKKTFGDDSVRTPTRRGEGYFVKVLSAQRDVSTT